MTSRPLALAILLLIVFSAVVTFAQAPPMTVDVLGHRYLITRVGETSTFSFGAAAFDPVQRQLASPSITDLCGGSVTNMNIDAQGLAWDDVDGTYWFIDPDRKVYTIDPGAAPVEVFELPPTLQIPGAGPHDVVDPRGIALDDTHVYVVTAGPNPGAADSGSWFKLQRDGTPVSSSLLTDFNANLDEDPDAIVDGICWLPPGLAGPESRFLVALEHSGIEVLDANGFVVDEILWSQHGLEDVVPAAFAGITVDPAHGDLYLVDNDTGFLQRWMRLDDTTTAAYLSAGWTGAWLDAPWRGCAQPLWDDYGVSNPLIFGITYRHADGRVYGIDFGSGDLYSYDPRVGELQLVAATGVQSIWGLAYDPERDVLYGAEENFQTGHRLHTIDPQDGSTTPFTFPIGHHVTDLAYNPDDQNIYGVSNFGPDAYVLQMGRDSGQGQFVGQPTEPVVGLGYDPALGQLVGKRSDNTLWSLDIATGGATPLGPATESSWEGLAVVPLSAIPTAAPAPLASTVSLQIQAFPNPSPGATRFAFELPREGPMQARILDARGRVVRELPSAPGMVGSRELVWDGTDGRGATVANGTYFLQLRASGVAASKALTILR